MGKTRNRIYTVVGRNAGPELSKGIDQDAAANYTGIDRIVYVTSLKHLI